MNPAITTYWQRRGKLGCIILGILSLALLVTHCAKSKYVSRNQSTQLVLINQSDCAWRITISSDDGAQVTRQDVAVGMSQTVPLSGGNYIIDQTMMAKNHSEEATRRLSMKLEDGRNYQWRLATLLSDREMRSQGRVDPPRSGHE